MSLVNTTAKMILSLTCMRCHSATQVEGTRTKLPTPYLAKGWCSFYLRNEAGGYLSENGEYLEAWLCTSCHSEYDKTVALQRKARKEALELHQEKWKEVLFQERTEREAIYDSKRVLSIEQFAKTKALSREDIIKRYDVNSLATNK